MVWQKELRNNIRTIDELKKYIALTKTEERKLKKVVKIHPMSITRYYLSLINKKDKNDPIRKIIVPAVEELDVAGSYDTSGEKDNTKMVGLQHKYGQTALIISTSRCPAYCRFCFRKRLVGLDSEELLTRFNDAVKYIKKHKEIDNVLISGGDAWMLPTRIIKKFLNMLEPIQHIQYIRFGSRMPVTFPDRILKDPELLKVLKKHSMKKDIYLVTHFNHPNEITTKSKKAIKKILDSGVAVNNQTVLMKGVNDNSKVLSDLLNNLIEIGVLPYYVFQCRPVSRVKHHFQVPLYDGYQIFEESKRKVKGHILCKRLKYVMSHKTGKVEIIGIKGNEIYLKYHQARNPKNLGKFFTKKLTKEAAWLDELKK